MTLLALSALCWEHRGNLHQLTGLRAMGIDGIEMVPGKMLPSWPILEPGEAMTARAAVAAEGLLMPAMQAIFFGKPGALLFDNVQGFEKAVLEAGELAGLMGIPCLVWGAPASRRRGERCAEWAFHHAVTVLRPLCHRLYGEHGVMLLIEANPLDYNCDFINTPSEAAALVQAVASRGFGLHLDIGGLRNLDEGTPYVEQARHIHASEKGLSPFVLSPVHTSMAQAVSAHSSAWVSLEMLPPTGGSMETLAAIKAFVSCYGRKR